VPETIETISMKLPMGLGQVNCYLLGSGMERVLIDTGPTRARGTLEWALHAAECEPGEVSLIVVTHGDTDHTGNCAYLRDEFKTKIAMHPDEVPAVKGGNLTDTRENLSTSKRRLARLGGSFVRLKKADQFKPKITIEGGESLSAYGINARVVHTPGHSKGSISVLTSDGDLFCGDLMENRKGPAPGSIVDDEEQQAASIQKVKDLGAKMVYPGHGGAFAIEDLG
jgi:glyoxylase-like metal-dependent hydrolase (beta-lactamase superfamily II)